MRAFVAGATGYTGRNVVERLAAAGDTVVAHIRPSSRSLETWKPRFEAMGATVDTTPWEPLALTAALARHTPTHVYALLGTTASRQKKHEPSATYEHVDRDLTLMLLQAASAAPSRPVFVYLSSIGADKPRNNRYLLARAEVERALDHGVLPWIAARPSFITGPDRDEDRLGERVGAVLGDGALAVLGLFGARTLRDRYSSLTGDQLAQSLIGVGRDPEARDVVVHTELLRRYVDSHSAVASSSGK